LGVPTAPIITRRFQDLVKTISYKKGMPGMRFTFVPHPIAGRTAEQSHKYILGMDPLTNRPVLQELIDALTQPLTAEEKKTGFLIRPPQPRLLPADTPSNLERLFHDSGWTDGLPIVLPTESRVAAMLRGTSRRADEIVGSMRPSPPHEAWEYTVELVAANAVMAGAKPEYFPVILALASSGVTSLFTSTTSFARMMVVNGPITAEIKMNSGIGAMGPFNEANATIGRTWTLISKNLGGGGVPGETYLGSQGSNLNYNNMCFPEAEEALPEGWNPFHVQKGFKAGESVVSTFSGWSISNYGAYIDLPHQEIMKWQLQNWFTSGTGAGNSAILLIDPVVARDLKELEKFDAKERLAEWLIQKAVTPAWHYWARSGAPLKQAKQGIEPFASWLKLGDMAFLPVSPFTRGPAKKAPSPNTAADSGGPGSSPGRSSAAASKGAPQDSPGTGASPIEIIVVGGGTNPYWVGGDFRYVASVSIDKWR
jgi:hypothetical protein